MALLQSSPHHQVAIRLFDGFALEAAGYGHVAIKNRKACALLAYLALSSSEFQTRERLAGLLWSDRSESQARASLRQCIKQLRNAFAEIESDAFRTNRREIMLDRTGIAVDLKKATTRIEEGYIGSDVVDGNATPDRILYGFESVDQAFAAWLHVIRQRWCDRWTHSLESTLRDSALNSAVRSRAAEALVQLDQTHEEAHRFLILKFAEEGNVAAALRQYNNLWELLDREYDMEPAEDTQELIVRIKSGPPLSARERPSLPAVAGYPESDANAPDSIMKHEIAPPKRLVLVVNEFGIEGVDPEKTYIVSGFRHDLIASLVRFRDWTVVEGADPASLSVGSSPRMSRYLIQATALGDSDDTKLVLTLKDHETGQYVWSDRYTINLERWFEAQQLIVRRVAVALNVHLSAERLTQIAGEPDVSLPLYDRWLRGQESFFQWRPKAMIHASNIFRSIIEEAPNFAPAYSSMVQIANSRHLIFPGVFRTADREKEALSLAKIAVQIDPIDSKTHLCLAWSHALNRQFEPAELSYQLAHDLNENDPWTLVSSSHGFAFCGQKDLARELADQALELGLGISTLHWGYQVGIRFLCEDYEACVAAADHAQGVIYNLPAWKASALAHLGRTSEAEAEGARFLALMRSNWYGDPAPDDAMIVRWLLHCFPIRLKSDWERLRDGLHRANVPIPDQRPQL